MLQLGQCCHSPIMAVPRRTVFTAPSAHLSKIGDYQLRKTL